MRKENSWNWEKCRKGLLWMDPGCLGNDDAPGLPPTMLAQSRDCTLNCVPSLATTHQSSSLAVASLQPRSCHSVWVQPQIPKLTFPHASLICLLSPLRLLNWQGNAWTRHSWVIPHSGQGKGRLFPWLNYFKPIQRKRKIPHEVKILSS